MPEGCAHCAPGVAALYAEVARKAGRDQYVVRCQLMHRGPAKTQEGGIDPVPENI